MFLHFLLLMFYIANTVTFRTSTCFHDNEEFSLCGWRCPMTCVNIKLLYISGGLCSSKWECHVGCRCSAGYVRDEFNKNCVLVQNCPVGSTMAITLILFVLVAAASAAPPVNEGLYRDWQQDLYNRVELNNLQDLYPAKRSSFGNLYVSPCAAAASAYSPSASIPTYGPASHASATPYYNQVSYHKIPGHQAYAPSHYGQPYYRMEDQVGNEQEMMGMSDMNHITFDHVPMARSSYGAAPIVNPGQPPASGPVVGVFSNANVADCSVPLLVSCSPSIAHGRIVKSQPYYNSGAYAAQSNAYRGVEEQFHQNEAEEQQEKSAHSSSEHSPHNSQSMGEKHQ